jgi:hypothetical protein
MFDFRAITAAAIAVIMAAAPASATFVWPSNDEVTISSANTGFQWVVDFNSALAGSGTTTAVSALGNFTFTGVSNNGLTYNFDYSLLNDSANFSRLRAFSFDTTGTVNTSATNSTGALSYEYYNQSWPYIGTQDICFAAGSSGCTAHSSNGITSNPDLTGTGTFSVTFAQVMQSVTFDQFAVKFIDVNPKVNGQDWAIGIGQVTSMTNPQPITAPEPETWMLLLGGFGLIGSTLRRRNRALDRHQLV